MIYITNLLIAILPVILAGIANMIFVKTKYLNSLKIPMDRGYVLRDKRLFGDNKTWKGFIGMSVLTCIFTPIFALMYLNYAPFREVSIRTPTLGRCKHGCLDSQTWVSG
jgi:CDP-diglyceride synthetase